MKLFVLLLLLSAPATARTLDQLRECIRVRDSVYAATGDSNYAARKHLECLER